MKTFKVEVRQYITVEVDESKFTPEFMEEFRESFYQFDELEDHVAHLAQLKARGLHGLSKNHPEEFVEGYAEIGDFGVSVNVDDVETAVEATDV